MNHKNHTPLWRNPYKTQPASIVIALDLFLFGQMQSIFNILNSIEIGATISSAISYCIIAILQKDRFKKNKKIIIAMLISAAIAKYCSINAEIEGFAISTLSCFIIAITALAWDISINESSSKISPKAHKLVAELLSYTTIISAFVTILTIIISKQVGNLNPAYLLSNLKPGSAAVIFLMATGATALKISLAMAELRTEKLLALKFIKKDLIEDSKKILTLFNLEDTSKQALNKIIRENPLQEENFEKQSKEAQIEEIIRDISTIKKALASSEKIYSAIILQNKNKKLLEELSADIRLCEIIEKASIRNLKYPVLYSFFEK